jgi:hypothetical protein
MVITVAAAVWSRSHGGGGGLHTEVADAEGEDCELQVPVSPDGVRELPHSYPRTMSACLPTEAAALNFPWQESTTDHPRSRCKGREGPSLIHSFIPRQERMCIAITWIVFSILVHNNEPRLQPPVVS